MQFPVSIFLHNKEIFYVIIWKVYAAQGRPVEAVLRSINYLDFSCSGRKASQKEVSDRIVAIQQVAKAQRQFNASECATARVKSCTIFYFCLSKRIYLFLYKLKKMIV